MTLRTSRNNKDVPATVIIAQLNGKRKIDAFEAAKRVLNSRDGNALVKELLETLTDGKKAFRREAAAYAVQTARTPETIVALERTLRNKSENARVRGQAAESLAHCHGKETHDVLLTNLRDPSKDVRFWCAFALGQMKEKRALPVLRTLLHDKRVVQGFHSVAKEAADSIAKIEETSAGRRCHYCVRSKM